MSKSESFSTFYQKEYLPSRNKPKNRLMHFIGCLLVILTVGFILGSGLTELTVLVPVFEYGFAIVGFYLFENKTADIFESPFYNLAGDWVMFKDILLGKVTIF